MKRPLPQSQEAAPITAEQREDKTVRNASGEGSGESNFSAENFVGTGGDFDLTAEDALARVEAVMARYNLPSRRHLLSQEDSAKAAADISLDKQTGKPVSLHKLFAETLDRLGYRSVGKLAYQAGWSTDEVEHFLSFDTYGTPRVSLTGDAGLKNRDAEAFAARCLVKYGDEAHREHIAAAAPWKCFMHFSVGMLAGWGLRGSLTTARMTERQLSDIIATAVRDRLRPYVGSITTGARLLEFLLRDEEPMIWVRTNAAARIAEIAWLARRQGENERAIEKLIQPHLGGNLRASLGGSLPPEQFAARVVEDSAEAPSSSQKS